MLSRRHLGTFRVLAAAAVLLAARTGSADQITLDASADNTIYSNDGTLSNGQGDHLFSGATRDNGVRRALIRFDVAAGIPAGSIITAVTLRLYLSRERTDSEIVSLHRLLASWGEGTSHAAGEEGGGAPATPGDATWTHRFFNTQTWSVAGGSYAAASGSAVVGAQANYYTWSSAGMVGDVQGWLNTPATNFGWILIGNEAEARVADRFDSRDNDDPTRRPDLIVTFTPPAATGACCAEDGGCTVVTDPGGSCGGSYQGSGTSCTPNLCPQPEGACCFPTPNGQCSELTEASCTSQGGTFEGIFSACAETQCAVVLQPFVDALPRPAVAQPTSGVPGGAASYQFTAREIPQQLHRDLLPTTVWGFTDGSGPAGHPGPTIEAGVDQPVNVTWRNDLRDSSGALRTRHYLPVDQCLDGPDTEGPSARIVFHLHGAHVEAASDGYPEDTLLPGAQDIYHYANRQLPATLWYHDHALGITRLNVMMGLAGFYLLRDAFETGLGLPAGEFEIGLALQDRKFRSDGSFDYPAAWEEHFFGDTVLVNGKVWPYLNVKRGKYRFRILDGSNSRTYRLHLSSGAPFQVIGMEGGLLPAPAPVSQVTLGPGERADVVVDFAPYAAGTEILLLNDAPAPFPGSPGVGVIPNVMKFVVGSQTGHTAPLPSALRPIEPLDPQDAVQSREFQLAKSSEPCTGQQWTINGLHWDDITEFPVLGTTEIWSFVNRSGVTHPMHMHLVMFQVLDRQAFELVNGQIVPIGSRVPPPPHEAAWKDTVQVGPNEIVRVIARFEDYTGRFAYHCHILEHEDHEMMRQFQAVTACGDGVLGVPAEECDDGNTAPGDGCSASCTVEDECQNGVDDDGDGLADFGSDPGCSSAADFLETAPGLVCDDGVDNDGDGFVDVPDDPGCRLPTSTIERTQCQDGLDNDADARIDFDGGASLNGGVPVASADPQCTAGWRNRERQSSCGLGFELVGLGLPWLGWRRRVRRR